MDAHTCNGHFWELRCPGLSELGKRRKTKGVENNILHLKLGHILPGPGGGRESFLSSGRSFQLKLTLQCKWSKATPTLSCANTHQVPVHDAAQVRGSSRGWQRLEVRVGAECVERQAAAQEVRRYQASPYCRCPLSYHNGETLAVKGQKLTSSVEALHGH